MSNLGTENIILTKTFAFSVQIVELCKTLQNEKEFIISKQVLRSGTSIGANMEEAIGGVSKADFSNKVAISYKEARETHYWIRLLKETNYIDEKTSTPLINDCDEICRILYSILKTSRTNRS